MALPASGAITLGAIGTEFGDTAPNSLSDFYRNGSLVKGSATFNQNIPTSGGASLSNFYNASKVFQYVVGPNTFSSIWYLRPQAISAGWNGTDKLLVLLTGLTTFNSGIYVDGNFPNGVGLEIGSLAVVKGSNGTQGTPGARGIGGMGGNLGHPAGYPGSAGSAAGNGFSGGPAIQTTVSLTINNYGSILGGEGGLAGVRSGGGGGGGGAGSYVGGIEGDIELILTGGAGGNGYGFSTFGPYAGIAGSSSGTVSSGSGGAGGSSGLAGFSGTAGIAEGGVAATQGAGGAGGAGGAAGANGSQGNYIVGNSLVTWINTGYRTGGVVA